MVYENEVSTPEYNEIQEQTYGKKEIKYTRPKFIHRVLANLLDFIVFAVLFIALFIAARKIVGATPGYKNAFNSMTKARLDSGLYVEGDVKGEITDLVSYLNSHSQYTPGSKVYNYEKNLNKFFTFQYNYNSLSAYDKIYSEYDRLRINFVSTDYQGTPYHLWKEENGQIVKTELYDKAKWIYANWYQSYFDDFLQGYLATTPFYYDLTKTISNYLFFVEIPSAFFLSLILVYFVPTVCFRHGRMTLGKSLYHIGTVDSRYLSPTFWRNLAKFGIFILEMVAGIVTLGIVYLVSFSMMAFTKKRQSFPEFMLNLQEVDTSKNRVYMSMVEVTLANAQTNKKATDFRLIDNP